MSIVTSQIPTAPTNNTSTTPTTNTTNTSNAAGSGAAAGQKQLDTTYSDFLTLLLTQLKNQDPTSPVDTNQFTQQLVSLSEVQQSVNTNSNLEKLIAATQSSQASNAVSYIGRTVDATGNQAELLNGSAEFSYSLPSAAKSATVTISDSTGKVVYSADGPTAAGKNIIGWDGSTTAGTTAPDGIYSISVTAKDSTGADLTPTTYTTGAVSSINIQNGAVVLSVGDGKLQIPLENVVTVRPAAVAANDPTTTPTS